MLHGALACPRRIVFLRHVVMGFVELFDGLVQPRNPPCVQIGARMIFQAFAVIGDRLQLRECSVDFRDGVAFLIVELTAIRVLDQSARSSQVPQRVVI